MTALVNSRPTNVWQRIGLLFAMEWGTQKRNILAVTGTLCVVALAIAILISVSINRPISVEGLSGYIFGFSSLFLMTTMVYTYIAIQRQVNHSKTIAYTIIPASVGEKYVVLLLSFLFPFIWTIVLLAMAILFLGILLPSTWTALYELWMNLFFIEHIVSVEEAEWATKIVSSLRFYFILYNIVGAFCSIAMALWCCINVRGTTQSILAYIGLNAVLGIFSSVVVLPAMVARLSYIEYSNSINEREVMDVIFSPEIWSYQLITLGLAAILFYILSYFSLKKRQLR